MRWHLILQAGLTLSQSDSAQPETTSMASDLPPMIRGTYGYPASFWQQGLKLDDDPTAHPVDDMVQFEDPSPRFVKICFNESCRATFRQPAGITLPEGSIEEQSRWIFMQATRGWETGEYRSGQIGHGRFIRSSSSTNPQANALNYQLTNFPGCGRSFRPTTSPALSQRNSPAS